MAGTGDTTTDEFVSQEQDEAVGGAFADRLEVSPVTGMDLATFRNYLSRALNGDESVPAEILSFISAARQGINSAGERRREQDFFWRLAAEASLRRLEELIETKRAERDLLLADIRDDERQLAIIDRHAGGMARACDYFTLHGEFELNERGELADADAEDMLKAWEKRTGGKIDRRDAADVLAAFKEQSEYEKVEALRLQKELELERERVRRLDEEIKELERTRREAEDDLNSHVDPREIDADLQRELIAKGHGTDEQKQALAEEQGIDLRDARVANALADDFDAPPTQAAPGTNNAMPLAQPPPKLNG